MEQINNRPLVASEENLYRRSWSNPVKNYMNPDGTATSRVFKLRTKDNGELSVDVASLTTSEAAVGDKLTFMLFQIANTIVIENDLQTYYDPLPDGSNNAHAVITGMNMEDEIVPGILARKSKRIFFIER